MDEQAVREFVEEAESILEASPQMDEEPTKFRLILPFIELLGWDTRSTEVEPEYTVRIATRTTQVDFALLLGDTPVVFVEAKPARSNLNNDNVEQLRSYMRQELDVDWGVVTNGKSFEVLTKGDDGKQEEISLIQFDLSDLKERPDLLEIISKEAIQSGKSDEIATQIAQTGEAIGYLRENKEQVSERLNDVLLDEIGTSVPLDTEAQTTEFIENIISALKNQQREIGTTPSQEIEKENPSPEQGDTQDHSGKYVVEIQNTDTTLATFSDSTQSDVMAEAVSYLIENYDLISEIEPLPYIPGREKAIINDEPTSPHDEDAMRAPRELKGSYYLETHANKEGKKRTVRRLTDTCGLDVEFEGEW